MEVQELWGYVKDIFAALDFVAIMMVWFITNQLKEMVKKKNRRLVPLGVSIVMAASIFIAGPAAGPFGGHIELLELPIYSIAYFAMSLGMYHVIKRFRRGGYDPATMPDRRAAG
jgi:hypothetical protein